MTAPKDIRKRTPQRWVIPVIVIIASIVMIIGAYFIYQSRQDAADSKNSRVSQVKNMNLSIPGGKGTTEYNRTLSAYEKEQSDIADRNGKTRLSTIIGKNDAENLIDDAIAPEAPEIPTPKVVKAPTVVSKKINPQIAKAASDKADMEYQKQLAGLKAAAEAAVANEMAMINKTMAKSKPHQLINVYKVDIGKLKPSIQTSSQQSSGLFDKIETTPFEVGDVLYAINEIAVNSDVPSPVVVKILSGSLKGGKFIGGFKRYGKQLLLEFDEFSFNNKTIGIHGYAVDPSTNGVALRSDVDSHYVSRWGGLIAASFLEGFGESVRMSGVNTYTTGLGTVVQNAPDYSIEDQSWIAAGKVGERLAVPMYQNFYRPPTVYLDPGIGLGVLIIAN